MLSSSEQCSDCNPSIIRRSLHALRPALSLSSVPFVFTFILVAFFAWRRLFPLLSGRARHHNVDKIGGATRRASFPLFKFSRPSLSFRLLSDFLLDRAAAITFSTTIALSAVLAELIFCEISNIVNPATRRAALETTITILLVSLVVVTPALEIHSITSAVSVASAGKSRLWVGLALDFIGLGAWLVSFWWIGRAVSGEAQLNASHGFSKGSLERIGIIGIALMACLAGFAAVSSLWQTFGVKAKKVTETDIARKQAGLDAALDLLAAKESRLRALERKMSDVPTETFFSRMVGSFRGNGEKQEVTALRLEISGLETMQVSLSNSVALLRNRRTQQLQASTAYGRVCLSTTYVFSLYCLYRIGATLTTTLRRWWSPSTTFASTDPINNVLALIAKHWDPTLDREAWSRQISFLLSGVMLLASFNAVLQTVVLFSRFTPARLLHSAQQNLALLVSQISATYVVSSALLLRSNLPREMGSVIEGALGAPLDTAFMERWFEGWFLVTCGATSVGIWIGRKLVGSEEWDDDFADEVDLESGRKRSV